MDELAATIRDALLAQGASASTAHLLAVGMAEAAHAAIERDKLERKAQLLLTLGPNVAAERLGVCRATVYNLAHRARRKSKENATA
jgi:DNA-directed RNA polymerase specialized sigma24 family protein